MENFSEFKGFFLFCVQCNTLIYEERKHTLLYGYSLIIAKNFVTVYTAFDY